MSRNCMLNDFDRGQIIGLWRARKTTRDIAQTLGRTQSQVARAIKAFKDKGQITVAHISGRPKSLSERDLRQLKRTTLKNRHAPLKEIAENLTNTISETTARRYLHDIGYYSRVASRKPFISVSNQKKRFKWCVERKSWVQEWQYIIWSDESRYNLYHNDGRQRVWRQPKEKYDVDCLVPTFKHGGGSIMVWGCFVNDLIGPLVIVEGKMTGKSYQDLLEKHLLPFLHSMEDPALYTFQDDNAAIHTARTVINWKEENSISSIPWPAQSPDLNPIEHVWDHLERAVHKRKPFPKTINELKDALKDEWNKIGKDYLQNLVQSIPRRVKMVIEKEGKPTEY